VRIAILQERARHAAHDAFREGLCLQRAFDRLGVESIVWGPGYPDYDTPFADIERAADVLFIVENYDETGWIPKLSGSRKLRVFWSIDAHCVLGRHRALAATHRVDVVLTATARYRQFFMAPRRRCHWFANAYPADLVRPLPEVPKAYDIGFCGSLTGRIPWLESLAEFGVAVVTQDREGDGARGMGMVRAVNSFRIHFNRNMADDINFRTFETLGCRTLLLTNHTPGLERLFDLEQHLVTYRDVDDLRAQVRRLLADHAALDRIAAAGHAHVVRHHTYDVRARQFLDLVGAL
jgi:hypothetical protein